MSKSEEAAYQKAFLASKGETVKDRMSEGEAAVKKLRSPPPAKPVENLQTMAQRRVRTIEEAVDGALRDYKK